MGLKGYLVSIYQSDLIVNMIFSTNNKGHEEYKQSKIRDKEEFLCC